MAFRNTARIVKYFLFVIAVFCYGSLFAQGTPDSADQVYHPSEQLLPGIERTFTSQPVYFLFIFAGGLIILALIRILASSYLKDVIISIFNLKVLLQMSNDGRFGFNTPSLFLDLLSVTMFGILFQQMAMPQQPYMLGWIITFTAVVYFLKLILIQLLSYIFFGRGEALVHILMHLLFTRMAGIILFPAIFINLYQNVIAPETFFRYILFILLFLYILWISKLYLKLKSVSVSGTLYLFLYLCTIELSPLFVLAKGF